MRPRHCVLAVLLQACNWVNQADFDNRIPDMDDDQDGYVKADDCDDADADISPGAEEVWYDGIDQDCGGNDDYDADQDGYVNETFEGLPTEGVTGSGSLLPGDCDDNDATINPAATDAWYTGIDENCGGEDDYDADADGYVADENKALTTVYVDESGGLPNGDCDDDDELINPDAYDAWYTGVDEDCGGEDDYDADQDNYVPDEYAGQSTTYVENSGSLSSGDCDDDDPSVSPAEEETWYNDTDDDCDESTIDDDADSDGYIAEEAGGDDCDDFDATINVGSIEILGDTEDQDCDGGDDTFLMLGFDTLDEEWSDFEWTNPHNPVFSSNSSTIYLSVAATQISWEDDTETLQYNESAIAFGFDAVDPTDAPSLADWHRNLNFTPSFELGQTHDFVATDEMLYGAVQYVYTNYLQIKLFGFDLADDSRNHVGTLPSSETPFDDIGLALDASENLHVIGCENTEGIGQYLRTDQSNLLAEVEGFDTEVTDLFVTTCALHFYDDSGYGSLLSGSPAEELSVTWFDSSGDNPEFTALTGSNGSKPVDIVIPRDDNVLDTQTGAWTVVIDAATSSIIIEDPDGFDTSVTPATPPVAVHATLDATGDLVLAYVTESGAATVQIGQPSSGAMATYPLVVDDFIATSIAATLDPTGQTLLVALFGSNGAAIGMAELF